MTADDRPPDTTIEDTDERPLARAREAAPGGTGVVESETAEPRITEVASKNAGDRGSGVAPEGLSRLEKWSLRIGLALGLISITISILSWQAAQNANGLASRANQIAETANEIAHDATDLAGQANQIANAANALAQGANDLAADANGLAGGANDLANDANDLANRANELASDAIALQSQDVDVTVPEFAAIHYGQRAESSCPDQSFRDVWSNESLQQVRVKNNGPYPVSLDRVDADVAPNQPNAGQFHIHAEAQVIDSEDGLPEWVSSFSDISSWRPREGLIALPRRIEVGDVATVLLYVRERVDRFEGSAAEFEASVTFEDLPAVAHVEVGNLQPIEVDFRVRNAFPGSFGAVFYITCGQSS